MNTNKPLLLIVYFLQLSLILHSEVLDLPPFNQTPNFEGSGFFQSFYAWSDLRHFLAKTGGPYHSWEYDLGVNIYLYSWKNMNIQFQNRLIYQHQLSPISEFYFSPNEIITDYRLEISLKNNFLISSFAFSHDCKHDVEKFRGRAVAHDVLHLMFTHTPVIWNWPLPSFSTALGGQLALKYNLLPLFQNNITPEPDKMGFRAQIDIEPVKVKGLFTTFFQAQAELLNRDLTTEVILSDQWAFDWSLRAGISAPNRQRGFTLYLRFEHISDDWVLLEPKAITPFSAGIMFVLTS